MKNILLWAAVLCGMTSFAATEVKATFASLENGATSGDYKVEENCISGGTAWTYTDYITVIVKYSGLPTSGKQAIATIHQSNDDNRVGVYADGRVVKGIWQGNEWNNVTGQSLEESGTIVLVYAPSGSSGTTVYDASGTAVYTAGALKDSTNSFGDKINVGAKHDGSMKLSGFSVDAVQILKGAAQSSEITALVAAFEEAIKPAAPTVESVLLLNFGKSNPTGWVTCNEMNVGGNIPQTGTLSQEGSSATFRIAGDGNFFNEDNKDFDLVTNGTFSNGTYRGTDGKDYETIEAEVKSSLGLADNVVFDSSVYGCGLQNGGYADHTATIGGLDATAKYIVYVGYGMHKSNQCAGFKITSDQCSSVDSIDYVTTVAGTGTLVANAYTAAEVGAELRPGENGLLIVRLTNVVPTSSGEIKFAPHGERSGINFLAVAKVNEIEEPGEEEEMVTIDYPATGFLTSEYQDTGWQVTLDEILKYGSFTGTMDGGWVTGNNVPAQGFHKKTGTDGSVAVVEFQMQIYQDGGANNQYLKGTRVFAKEENGTIWLRAVASGNISLGALGTEITSWNGTLAKAADQAGYGVASVALSITKPADKKPQGSIGEVTTAHSEDYTSNTITAKVTIENDGEYKGVAVLVYTLGETQHVAVIEEGSATITVPGLNRETVYRGTLALGQKIGEDVTVIEGAEQPVALYQGEQKFVWIASPFKIQDAMLVNDAQGLTIENPFADPDYVDLCDSEYTVSISASEAVDAENDAALDGTEQGGVRIAQTSSGLKLQVVDKGDWVDFADAAVNTTYTLTVKFHYKKSQEGETDATSVTYTLDSTTKTSTNTTGKLKVMEIFVSDGTNLANNLLGACQLDSAVIVDLELKPGEGDAIDYNTEAEANAAIKTLKIGICDVVKSVLTTAEAQENYRKYFHLVVVPSKMLENGFSVMPEFTTEATNEIEKELEKALADVVNAFNSGSAEIVGKPGLYYGVKRGDSLEAMSVKEDLQMAGVDGKVTISITKPDNSKSHFYRIIVSPTPAKTK